MTNVHLWVHLVFLTFCGCTLLAYSRKKKVHTWDLNDGMLEILVEVWWGVGLGGVKDPGNLNG